MQTPGDTIASELLDRYPWRNVSKLSMPNVTFKFKDENDTISFFEPFLDQILHSPNENYQSIYCLATASYLLVAIMDYRFLSPIQYLLSSL